MIDPPVQEMPVQSMLTNPSAGDIIAVSKEDLEKGTIKVKGIAWGGGGSGVNRVDVSVSNVGEQQEWTRADLIPRPIKQRRRSEWAWQFFEKELELSQEVLAKLRRGY